jgi:hypothetical protein
MKVFIAEETTGRDAKTLKPFKDAIVSTGGKLTDRQKDADCFVLPWTATTAAAKQVQAMATEAVRQAQASGNLRLYILPLSETPVPRDYEFYLVAACVLPEEASEAAAIVIHQPEDASCDH